MPLLAPAVPWQLWLNTVCLSYLLVLYLYLPIAAGCSFAVTCGDPVTQAFQERSKLDVGP